jgi:hypothetical protein
MTDTMNFQNIDLSSWDTLRGQMRRISLSWAESRQLRQLFVKQSPPGKDVSTKAEDIVGIRYQSTTSEGIETEKT